MAWRPVLFCISRLSRGTIGVDGLRQAPVALLAANNGAHCRDRAWAGQHLLHWPHWQQRQGFSSQGVDREVEEINALFVAARDEIEYAKEEAETVYFNDSVKQAKEAVAECLDRWHTLLHSMNEQEKSKLQRSMGLKMEQLKAELDQVVNMHLE